MPKISLIWNNGEFKLDLCAADKRVLENAREIGRALDAMKQESGLPLIDAIDAIWQHPDTENTTDKPF